MLRRHQIFNLILTFWESSGQSSTPRRGELRHWLKDNGIPLSRTAVRKHLAGLVDDGFISIEKGVIVLNRREQIAEVSLVTVPPLQSIQD